MDTFVVRLWDAGEADPAADPLRGTALHVASGESTPFVGVDALLGIFAAASVRKVETMRQLGDLEGDDEPDHGR